MNTEHQKIEALGNQLHWFHWVIIVASLSLTLAAWYISKTAIDEKVALTFDKDSSQVVELIQERMSKYEDALWAGTAAIHSQSRGMDHQEWRRFSQTLRLETRYPGINGIGVIQYISPEALPAHLKEQQQERPNYRVHPKHALNEYWPIVYIEPEDVNAKAVGLDMAHEKNRHTAAKKARDTGQAQITGPIVLVQDAEKTPGFLFFAPYYTNSQVIEASKIEHFEGLVYAPFIMSKLMDGTLDKNKRNIGVKIMDQADVLYDEHIESEPDYDSSPMFSREITLSMYGRDWSFDLRTTLDFRESARSNQPLIILIGGLLIDILLISLFFLFSYKNRSISSALDKAELTHQGFIDASCDGYWDWDIQSDNEYISPRFWEILGYSSGEQPSAWRDSVFEEDLLVTEANFNQHVATKGVHPYKQELRCWHKNGSIITVLSQGKVTEWDSKQNPIRMVGTHTDITYLKNVETRLTKTTEQYDLAVEGSSVGLWDWDIKNDTVYWSSRFKKIVGLPDTYIPTLSDYEQRLHPNHREATIALLTKHLENRNEYDSEYQFLHEDGHYIWLHVRGQAVWDKNGKPIRMAGSADDITANKIADIALEEAVNFQKLLIDVNTDLVFVKDRQFKIVTANTAFLNLYPESMRDKVIGYTTIEDYDADQANEFLKEDKKAFTEGLSEVIELIDFPDGSRRTLLTKKIRFEDIKGNQFILAIARDITVLKETEDALRYANTELEEFAYRTSHDLRSPLISSSKLLEIIRTNIEKGNNEKSVDYIKIVQSSLKKLEDLVSDILTLTKISHSESPITAIDIESIVKQSLTDLSYMDGFDRIKITTDYQLLGPIFTQKENLTLIIDNLLSNAIKYQNIKSETPSICISTEPLQGFVKIIIADNGLGIPEESREKMFEMFRRFHPNTAFGSGLGLYMVKKSVDKMAGTIEYFDSKPGTTFVIKIPINT